MTILASNISPATQAPIDLVAAKNAVRDRLNKRLDLIARLLDFREQLYLGIDLEVAEEEWAALKREVRAS